MLAERGITYLGYGNAPLSALTCCALNSHVQHVDQVSCVVQQQPQRKEITMEFMECLTYDDNKSIVGDC